MAVRETQLARGTRVSAWGACRTFDLVREAREWERRRVAARVARTREAETSGGAWGRV